jgi:hypothetical protein
VLRGFGACAFRASHRFRRSLRALLRAPTPAHAPSCLIFVPALPKNKNNNSLYNKNQSLPMLSLSRLSLLLSLIFVLANTSTAQIKLPKLKIDVNSPIVQMFIKKALQEYIPRVTGKDEKVKDIKFTTNKTIGEVTKLKGTVIFQNPKAALGNGNYRFKLKMNSNLLNPKIHSLRLQVLRIWFIRFYKKVI